MKYVDLAGPVLASAIAALLNPSHALADPVAFPQRPIKLVVAFAAGGNNDVPMRIVAAPLGEVLNTSVVVENRAGAGGTMGTDFVAKAPADGHTLLNCNSATHGVNPAIYKKLPYDVSKNFSPVSLVGSAPNVLLVPVSSPIRSAQDMLAQIKSPAHKLAVATAGVGSTQHFSLELIKAMTGADILHVPYKGGALALADLMGGQVPAAITGLPTALTAIKGGKVRALAVTGSQRSPHIPEVPTLAESGLPGYEVTTWTGLCAPAGTPGSVIEQLNAGVRRTLESPAIQRLLMDAAIEPAYLPADRFAQLISAEVKRFSIIVEKAGIVLEP